MNDPSGALALTFLFLEYVAVAALLIVGGTPGGAALQHQLFYMGIPLLGVIAAILSGMAAVSRKKPSWIVAIVAALFPLGIVLLLLATVSH
jgi:hypothetical protein